MLVQPTDSPSDQVTTDWISIHHLRRDQATPNRHANDDCDCDRHNEPSHAR